MKSVIFVCIGNSCRSQMAESIAKKLSGGKAEVFSAGSVPAGYVHPMAIEVLIENSYDVTGLNSKSVDLFNDRTFDHIVTMGCGDSCPNLKGKNRTDWNIPDPKDMPKEEFVKIMHDLETKIRQLLSKF